MSSPTVLITGATDGLGRALADHLAADGYRLILHGRDPERLAATAAQLAQRHSVPVPDTVLADFASLREVRGLSSQVGALTDHLDVLVSNAGIGPGTVRQVSVDGHELRFAVNYLAGFDLTLRLMPLLRAAGAARVVNVASLGQSAIDWDDVMIERNYSGFRAYGQSKLAQITSGFALAEKLVDAEIGGVTVNSLHPSTLMPTKIVMQDYGSTVDTLEAGEAATRRLVTDPGLVGVSGQFFDRLRVADPDPSARDPQVQRKLWELSLELTGAPNPTP
jgi:NAD(P)-dependent dehydrogenase (short-subunit alcohol dehydrogenase family)